jgi:hypothetical protein
VVDCSMQLFLYNRHMCSVLSPCIEELKFIVGLQMLLPSLNYVSRACKKCS